MQYYFKLQFTRINRHIKALGFNSWLFSCIVLVLFTFASLLLFQKIKYAPYIYIGITIWTVSMLGSVARNNYLKQLFSKRDYLLIRLFENFLTVLPFLLVLLYLQKFMFALFAFLVAACLSFASTSKSSGFYLPTPFYKFPFEFIAGFRKNILLFIVFYSLTVIAISVDNFNLGAVALIACLLACLGFYSKPEPKFFVWMHALNPASFLIHKIKIAALHGLIIAAPITLALLIFYPSFSHIVLVINLLGLLYLVMHLLGKYAYYPAEVNIIQMMALAFSILFPPFLFIIIPYFYSKATKNLAATVL